MTNHQKRCTSYNYVKGSGNKYYHCQRPEGHEGFHTHRNFGEWDDKPIILK